MGQLPVEFDFLDVVLHLLLGAAKLVPKALDLALEDTNLVDRTLCEKNIPLTSLSISLVRWASSSADMPMISVVRISASGFATASAC